MREYYKKYTREKLNNTLKMKQLLCKKVVLPSKRCIKGSKFHNRSKISHKTVLKNQSVNYIEQFSQDDINLRNDGNKLNENVANSSSGSNNNCENDIDYKSLYEESESMNLILQLKVNYLNAQIKELISTQQHVTLGLKTIQSSILDCMILDEQETQDVDEEIYYENNSTSITVNDNNNQQQSQISYDCKEERDNKFQDSNDKV